MNLVNIRALAFEHLGNRKAHKDREKGFIYYHGQRVANIALELRKMVLPDDAAKDEIVTVAAYFHDVAKGIEPHSYYGSTLVKEILQDECTPEELEQIAELIRYHQFRDKTQPYHDYIKILQDADILDHVGVIEVWMNFQYYAHIDGTIADAVTFYQQEYDSLAEKIRNQLNFTQSIKIYDEKNRFVKDFAQRMAVEAAGDIFARE